jgi:hypothetical protein
MNKEVLSDNAASISRRYFARNVVATAAITFIPTVATDTEKMTSTSPANPGPRPEGLSVADWDEVHAKYTNLCVFIGKAFLSREAHLSRYSYDEPAL